MGAFSDLAIDINERAQAGRVEWAVILTDEKRPAKLWRVIGEARGHYWIEDPKKPGETIAQAVEDCWIVA